MYYLLTKFSKRGKQWRSSLNVDNVANSLELMSNTIVYVLFFCRLYECGKCLQEFVFCPSTSGNCLAPQWLLWVLIRLVLTYGFASDARSLNNPGSKNISPTQCRKKYNEFSSENSTFWHNDCHFVHDLTQSPLLLCNILKLEKDG